MPANPARVQELFLAALDLPELDRAAHLDHECAGDAESRVRVEALLRAHDSPDSLLDAPASPFAPAPGAAAEGEPGFGFALGEEVGRGANGVVFRARQRGLNRVVAVKMALGLERAARHSLARFLAEAEAVAAISHPHVVRVYGFGQRDGVPFLAMEYLDGGTLADRLRRGPLPPRDAAALVAKVASGVAAAHALGIVHRDLKPGNVLLDEGGEPKVTDFGLARRGAGSDLTATHAVMGTPAYMSPEQGRGEGKFAGPQADVWALGVVLYECVAGRRPFAGASDAEVLSRITAGSPPALRAGSRSVPRDFDTIVTKCLSPEPAGRYPTAAGLADDLGRFVRGEPILARPAGRVERCARWVRRKPTAAAAYGLSALAVVLALVVFVVAGLWREAEGAKQDAIGARGRIEELLGTETRLRADLQFANGKLEGANTSLRGANAKLETALGGETATKQQAEVLAEKLARVEYGRTVQVAHQAWADGETARARALLHDTRHDLRGWEWHYAYRLCADPLVTWRGHDGFDIHAAKWSPDGTKVLTTARDNRGRVWDAKTGKELSVLEGHRGSIYFAAWSPDGKRILTSAGDRTITVWDVRSGEVLGDWADKRGGPAGAWSPDGKKVAIVYHPVFGRRKAFVADANSGNELVALELNESVFTDNSDNQIHSIAWNAAGNRIVTASEDKTAQVFDAATGKQLFVLKGHTDVVRSAAFSPRAPYILTASGDRTARLWDATTGEERAVLKAHTGPLVSATWAPDGSRFVTVPAGEHTWANAGQGHVDPTVRVWNAMDWGMVTVLQHPGSAGSVAWSPDGLSLVTASEGSIWMWDARTGAKVGVMKDRANWLSSPSFSPDGTRLLTVAAEYGPNDHRAYAIRVSDARTGVAALAVPVGDYDERNDRRYWASPDGFRVLVGATLWDARTRKEVAKLEGQAVAIHSAAWSPAGTLLATDSWEGAGAVWDATTGKKKAVLTGHTGAALAIMWHPHRNRILVVGKDGSAKVSDAATGRVLTTLAGLGPELPGVAWSPDGSRILTRAKDSTVRIRNPENGAEVVTIRAPGWWPAVGANRAQGWSPDGSRIAAFDERAGRVWDTTTGKEVTILERPKGDLGDAAWSPDGRWIAVASSDAIDGTWERNCVTRVWDANTGKEAAVLRGHTSTVHSVSWSPKGSKLVTASADGTARVWDATTWKELAVLKGHSFQLNTRDPISTAWSPDGTRVATASDNTVRVWDATSGAELIVLVGDRRRDQGGSGAQVSWSPDGKRIALNPPFHENFRKVRALFIWDATPLDQLMVPLEVAPPPRVSSRVVAADEPNRPAMQIPRNRMGHTQGVARVAFSPDGKTLASASWDSTIKLWDVPSGRERAALEGAGSSLAFSPDGKTLASGGDKIIKLWDVATGKERATLRGHTLEVRSVAYSPDGKTLVSGSADGTTRLWDASTGKEQGILPGGSFMAYSPDGKTLASGGSQYGTIKLRDAVTGKDRVTLQGHRNGVRHVAFSPDGKTLASGGEQDGTIRLWDTATGKERAVLRAHSPYSVPSVAFSPDGKTLAIGCGDNAIRLWDVSPEK